MESCEIFTESVLKVLEDLDCPRSLTVAIMVRNGEWFQLVNLRADPLQYAGAWQYKVAAIATELLRKCKNLPTGINTPVEAWKKFLAAERQCKSTNMRLRPFLENWDTPSQDGHVWSFIYTCKERLSKWLGPCPDEVLFRHGPGATYHDRGARATVPDKMQNAPSMTSSAIPALISFSRSWWRRCCPKDPLVVRGNRYATVPKDATTDRSIAIEPSLNVAFQLGLGLELRKRLKRVGLNLDTVSMDHRRKACAASISGASATIDLSSASDTMSSVLIQLMMPPDWFHALACLRSPFTETSSGGYLLEKFSSMGNGYTFELETMIFLSLVVTALEMSSIPNKIGVDVSVFGDDIIIPTEGYRAVVAVLRYFGFSINPRKSYSTGPFRESCGGDFFHGLDVRPVYVKEFPTEPHQWIAYANQLYRLLQHDVPIWRGWHHALSALPKVVRELRGPVGLGDIVIHDRPERWTLKCRDSIRYVAAWLPVGRQVPLERWDPDVQLASALYGVSSAGPSPRGGVCGYRKRWVAYS